MFGYQNNNSNCLKSCRNWINVVLYEIPVVSESTKVKTLLLHDPPPSWDAAANISSVSK